MARASGSTPRRRSGKRDSPASQIQINDDEKEKEQNRRSSNHHNARRHSLHAVARETLKNTTNPSQGKGETTPLLANFEQWMKLVKDNKINATNSWNFALIDYFHDMSLLREGDGINFQKASYTLDGCVKIYTSRVDSVATETGKLLSGLADSANQQAQEAEDVENEEEDGEGSDGEEQSKPKTKKKKKHAESTLASSFEQLQVKKLDLELSIDPLFRKMCADFDEGGAKGLLLNSLTTDKDGRVVFDGEVDYDSEDEDEENDAKEEEDTQAVDLATLRSEYLTGLSDLNELEVCPSMPSINNALNDPALLGSSIIKEIEGMGGGDTSHHSGPDMSMDMDFDDGGEDIGEMGGFEGLDIDENLTFGEPAGNAGDISTTYVANYGLNASNVGTHEQDIMSYFDETLKKNWTGPEHWKVQKLKASSLLAPEDTTSKKRQPAKEKEPFQINFLDDEHDVDESVIFAPGGNSIFMSKNQMISKTRNLLPNDKHFSSKNLIKLFTKPKGNIISFGMFGEPVSGKVVEEDINPDEHFWANQYQKQDEEPQGNYDADFFQDGGGNMDFDDGPEFDYDFGNDDGGGEPLPEAQPDDLKGQLLLASRRARPEYVNYAKTAKRVNVRLLKDNMWKALHMLDTGERSLEQEPHVDEQQEETPEKEAEELDKAEKEPEVRQFTEVVRGLQSVYSTQQMSEISTSFCFICVLHLANEKGLVLEDNPDYSDLSIRRDPNAPVGETPIA